MAGRHAKKWDKLLDERGRFKPVAAEETITVIPKFNDAALFLNERMVGPLAEVPVNNLPATESADAAQRWVRQHGWSQNPVTKLPRIVGVLLKLEEMALDGDKDAIKLFIDRVIGKQLEGVVVPLTPMREKTDEELLSVMKKYSMSNVAQSSIVDAKAEESHNPGVDNE